MTKPDFICIGPTKTATTWLFDMLNTHPQVWLPPFKEIRFFSEGNVVPAHSLWNVAFSRHWHYKILRRNLARNLKQLLSQPRRPVSRYENPWWFFRYCFGRRSFAWYTGLFPPRPELVCGDISPNYYEMPEEKIRDLAAIRADTKVIVFIRDPVDRVWSLATMVLLKDGRRRLPDVGQDEFKAYFDKVYAQWTPYRKAIARWKQDFQHVFVGQYSDLNASPMHFFRQITDFLGLEPDLVPESTLAQRVNVGMGVPIPPALRDYLKHQYADEIGDPAVGETNFP